MAAAITVVNPLASQHVYASQPGNIVISVLQSDIWNIMRGVDSCIRDSHGNLIWQGQGSFDNGNVTIGLNWPDVPGTYSLTAQARNVITQNVAATATREFVVESLPVPPAPTPPIPPLKLALSDPPVPIYPINAYLPKDQTLEVASSG